MRSLSIELEFTAVTCGECAAVFAVPEAVERSWRRSGQTWYCPSGHPRVFSDTLQKKIDALERDKAALVSRLDAERCQRQQAEKALTSERGKVTKLKKRVAAGVCPCCNRSFQNLRKHMVSKHPEVEGVHGKDDRPKSKVSP